MNLFALAEPTMAKRGQRWSKHPIDQDRMVWLQKVTKTGDGGRSRAGTSTAMLPSQAGPLAPATEALSDPTEARVSRPRDDWLVVSVPSLRSLREDARLRD